MGLFGNAFDFNNDGNLDALEQAAEFSMLMNILDSCEEDETESSDPDSTDYDF